MTPRLALVCVLTALLLASSVSLVYVQHQRRALFMELRGLERERDRMQIEWGRLQIEASTLGSQDRIEGLAVEQLGFRVPSPDRVVAVQP